MLLLLLLAICSRGSAALGPERTNEAVHREHPQPPVWPEKLHGVMLQNRSGKLSIVDLYYDFPGGRNLNLIQSQLGARGTTYDVEWNNKTSFYFDPGLGTCKVIHFDVGILRPDWLDGAEYLGMENVSGFMTRVWTKADFITYWEDEETSRPVRWHFHNSGMQFEVMSWESGDEGWPEDIWQAPASCFQDDVPIYDQTNNAPEAEHVFPRRFRA